MNDREDNLKRRIRELLKERNAILLAHNYQRAEVQDIADVTGDSLGLSQTAAETDAEVIVFCGVHFMAESAAILSPQKKVILPRMDAGCPMADMITADQLRAEKAKYPGVPVVTYVNSSAEVKAESDICCTSANAVSVARSLDAPRIYMTPDRNLAQWVARHTDQEVLYWDGYCPTHEWLTVEAVVKCKAANPTAPLIAHPECRPGVLDLADEILSTSGMVRYCKGSDAPAIIVGTEMGLYHKLQTDSPDKTFISPSNRLICPNMKLTSLDDVAEALETMSNVVTVEESIRVKAYATLEKMIRAGRD